MIRVWYGRPVEAPRRKDDRIFVAVAGAREEDVIGSVIPLTANNVAVYAIRCRPCPVALVVEVT